MMLNTPTTIDPRVGEETREHKFRMAIREAMRLALRAWEEYYNLPRSFETQAERRNGGR